MRMTLRSLPLVLISTLLLTDISYATPPSSVDQRIDFLMGANSHTRYHQFFDSFQRAVTNHDARQVATMLDYPLTAQVAGRDKILLNSQQFLAVYDKIFTPSLREVVRKQRYSDLFANSDGVMIGEHGEIWFSGICHQTSCTRYTIKIIRINGNSR